VGIGSGCAGRRVRRCSTVQVIGDPGKIRFDEGCQLFGAASLLSTQVDDRRAVGVRSGEQRPEVGIGGDHDPSLISRCGEHTLVGRPVQPEVSDVDGVVTCGYKVVANQR
jgi:hypothetical protein